MASLRDDLDFLLYRWLDVEALTSRRRYADHSRGTFDALLDTSERIARERFAPANRAADIEEPTFDGAGVRLPQTTAAALRAYAESGLLAAGHDYDAGGMQLPYVIDMAANAFFAMASVSLHAFGMLTYANANLVLAHGTRRQREAFARPAIEGRFFGTMALSEPQAGSSLADIATVAVPDGKDYALDPLGPRYRLRGHKMWISGAEHELGENIVHLVLAKIPGDDARPQRGVKGISLFIVPRLLLDAAGRTKRERNDVAVAGLNHKLGYRGIPNTLLNLGERDGAVGYRVGAPGDGLALMFHMMNEARIDIGLGAAMTGYAGYVASLEYARTRLQGRARGSDPSSPQVRIIEHADVKRMLLAQKAYCEGALALCLYCARLVDDRRAGDERCAADAALLLDLLTPIAKSWPSEWCLEANSLAIQVLGGYGYTRDFPVEQYWRDNRLNMIHEGTHGIQALDLLGRKARTAQGGAMAAWRARVEATCQRARGDASLAPWAQALTAAAQDIDTATRSAWSVDDARLALANATPFMQAFGHTVIAWIWLEVAVAASSQPPTDLVCGKRMAARYFFDYELPKTAAWLRVAAERNATCADMQDAWF
jgi:alkylation response protein AidB-like acyl-CoA dehydrogenase